MRAEEVWMAFYELTAWGPMTLTLVLLGVAFVVAVVVLPRRRRPGWRKHLEQAVALVLVSFLTVAGLFLKLNSDNQWYSSWADLLGVRQSEAIRTTTGSSAIVPAPTPPSSREEFTALQRDPRSNPIFGNQIGTDAPSGQWLAVRFTSPTTGITGQLLVWLPPSYLSRPDQAYPVLTAFAGYPGRPDAYVRAVSS